MGRKPESERRATVRRRRVAPGSNASRVFAAAQAIVDATHRGVTTQDIRRACPDLAAAASNAMSTLVRLRLLAVVGMRIEGNRPVFVFAPTDIPVVGECPWGPYEIAQVIVRRRFAETGLPVPIPAVSRALRATFPEISVAQINVVVDRLRRGAPKGTDRFGPTPARVTRHTDSVGASRCALIPPPSLDDAADGVAPSDDRAVDPADRPGAARAARTSHFRSGFVRMSLDSAAKALGRPASRVEWRLAVLSGALEIVTEIPDPSRLKTITLSVLPGIVTVRTPLTALGGAAPRYSCDEPTPVQVATCHLEDALYAYRPDQEERGISHLLATAQEWEDEPLVRLAYERERALRAALAAMLPDVGGQHTAASAADVASIIRHAADTLERWAGARDVVAAARHDTLTRTAHRLQALDAALPLLAHPDARSEGRPAVVGEALLVDAEHLRPYAQEVGRLFGTSSSFRNFFPSARRLPVERETPPSGPPPGAGIDRVDALSQILERVLLSRRGGPFLASAQHVLGHVVRDTALLQEVLVSGADRAPYLRHGLVVACGLLGTVPDPLLARIDSKDPEDLAAYLFAVSLADHTRALGRAEDVRWLVRGGAAEDLLDEALIRLEAGEWLTVVE